MRFFALEVRKLFGNRQELLQSNFNELLATFVLGSFDLVLIFLNFVSS